MIGALDIALGLPGQGMHLGVDPLSAFFLIILLPPAIAAGISAWRSGAFWLLVLALVLMLVAADAFALLFGLGLLNLACWRIAQSEGAGRAALWLVTGLFSFACLMPAVFCSGDLAFALLILGAGALIVIVPLHPWEARLPALPGLWALVSNGVPMIGFYILVRYGFVIDGSAIAPWWGVALLLAGAVSVLLGSVGALAEVALMRVLASARAAQNGMVAIGLGIALLARAVDDPALAVIAAEASLLGLAAPVLFMPLLELGAGRVMEATGTGSLDWLGGLMRGMPRLGGLMLWGSAGLAAVPLSPGFAPLFLLLHAAIGAAGTFGLIAALGFLLLLGLLGLCAGLLLMAAIRIIGIGFLGRPRSLRAAAAEEAELPVLLSMGLLALCSIPLALAPGMVLGALQPVIGLLVPSALALPVLGYAPLPLLLLLLALAGFAFLLLRRFGAHGARSVAPWHGGLGPPPAWLPFGDPLTQPSATGFSQPLRGMLALDAAPWRTQLVSRMPRPLRRRIVVLTVAFRRMSQAQ